MYRHPPHQGRAGTTTQVSPYPLPAPPLTSNDSPQRINPHTAELFPAHVGLCPITRQRLALSASLQRKPRGDHMMI
jgi:hypothetical protein